MSKITDLSHHAAMLPEKRLKPGSSYRAPSCTLGGEGVEILCRGKKTTDRPTGSPQDNSSGNWSGIKGRMHDQEKVALELIQHRTPVTGPGNDQAPPVSRYS